MIWSKFNYLCKSPENRNFLYNSRTNALMTFNDEVFEKLLEIEQGKKIAPISGLFDSESLKNLEKAKILVSSYEDENFISQKKYIRYKRSFNEDVLGIVIVPTYGCNFKCPYCYEKDLPVNLMPEHVQDQVIEYIKSFKKAKEVHLGWHGGEPLLAFKQIKRLLKKLREEKINLKVHNLVTNGYLLDEEKCNFFRDFKLDNVQITIDGLRESHNNSRLHKAGLPTYDVIMDNIDLLFRIHPTCHVVIRVNIHKENQNDFPLLCEEIQNRWERYNNYTISMHYANDHGNGCKVACFKNKEKILYTEYLVKQNKLTNLSLYPSPKLSGCTATFDNAYVIGVEGELYKCWVDVGKKERTVGNIFSKEQNTSLLSEYMVGTDMFTDNKCLNCTFLPICNGGCGLRRLEYKQSGTEYDVCPIDTKDFGKLLDLHYTAKLINK